MRVALTSIPTEQTRLKYYCGEWNAWEDWADWADWAPLREMFNRNPKMGSSPFAFRYDNASISCPLCDSEGKPRKGSGCNYFKDLRRLCEMAGLPEGTNMFVQFGDARLKPSHPASVPVITKVRELPVRRGVLLPLTYNRHFRGIWMTNETYVPWQQKQPALVWRGSATDANRWLRNDSKKANSRIAIVQKLAEMGQDVRFVDDKAYRQFVAAADPEQKLLGKPKARREIMHYKYVLSLEGNDVASGLKWSLAHNSVVVMPPPTRESWLMEGLLQPYVHYVPLYDPSGIEQLVAWLQSHEAECQQIIQNANLWMDQFRRLPGAFDELRGNKLVEDVLHFAATAWFNISRRVPRLGPLPVWQRCSARNSTTKEVERITTKESSRTARFYNANETIRHRNRRTSQNDLTKNDKKDKSMIKRRMSKSRMVRSDNQES
mmetsp:Transcript_11414/g.19194  ORF Transcript_11414/g.19194 Transcript_11414/m.19194 type:complete len:434 (+) Transcript_11414:52-1353(+)